MKNCWKRRIIKTNFLTNSRKRFSSALVLWAVESFSNFHSLRIPLLLRSFDGAGSVFNDLWRNDETNALFIVAFGSGYAHGFGQIYDNLLVGLIHLAVSLTMPNIFAIKIYDAQETLTVHLAEWEELEESRYGKFV